MAFADLLLYGVRPFRCRVRSYHMRDLACKLGIDRMLGNDDRQAERFEDGALLDVQFHEGSGIGGVHGLNAEKLGVHSVTPHPPRHVMKEALGEGDAPEPVRAKNMKQAILDAFGIQVKREVRRVL